MKACLIYGDVALHTTQVGRVRAERLDFEA